MYLHVIYKVGWWWWKTTRPPRNQAHMLDFESRGLATRWYLLAVLKKMKEGSTKSTLRCIFHLW